MLRVARDGAGACAATAEAHRPRVSTSVLPPIDASAASAQKGEQLIAHALRGLVALLEDVAAFKNIPYAAPPTAERRWRPPGPAPQWEGQRDASTYGAICIQATPQGDPGVGPLPMSEDSWLRAT